VKEKFLYTTAYLLVSELDHKGRGFGHVQGFAYLPNYETKIKVHINNDKFEKISDIDNSKTLILTQYELQCINKATQYVENSLQNLISLSKLGYLKKEAYGTSDKQLEY